jgi:membrane protein
VTARAPLGYTLKRTLHAFGNDACTDLAASLTYYTVLALFPGILAVVSILGLVTDAQKTIDTVLDLVKQFGSAQVVTLLEGPIDSLVRSPAAPVTFIVGVLGAVWSASGFVGAFGRAMNRIYGVREGRPVWKLRPTNLLVTIIMVVLIVVGALILVLSGPVATAIGNVVGLGDATLAVWSIVKWPILAVIAIVALAVLYHFAPNVRPSKFRFLSGGAITALVIWVVASVGFGFYVANFSHYNATYGSLGGVIVFLLWIWITNLALLFGAEFDAELERGRELAAGKRAEDDILLPERDTKQIDKKDAQHAKDVLGAIEIRQDAERR